MLSQMMRFLSIPDVSIRELTDIAQKVDPQFLCEEEYIKLLCERDIAKCQEILRLWEQEIFG